MNNPHLNFLKGTILEDKDQGSGIRDKGKVIIVFFLLIFLKSMIKIGLISTEILRIIFLVHKGPA